MKLLLILFLIAFLPGCGMRNQDLQKEHPYQHVLPNEDETITLLRVASNATVVTDYNIRQTLTVTVPFGTYVLRGKDSSNGRYFGAQGYNNITLLYGGLPILGSQTPQQVNGGVFVDAEGQAYAYWFWDSETFKPVRVRVPNLAFDISIEPDQERIRARLDRQERERLAREQERIAKERQIADAERKKAMREALSSARSRDRVQCAGAQCERAFAQAQSYLLKQADMRIQVATSTLIETYNATSEGQLQIRLLRVPTVGDRWEIVFSAQCRNEKTSSEELCLAKLIDAYSGFVPHMQLQ